MGLAMNSALHLAPVEEKAKSGKETLSQETGRQKVGPWVPSMILAQFLDLMPKASVYIAAAAAATAADLEPRQPSCSEPPSMFKLK